MRIGRLAVLLCGAMLVPGCSSDKRVGVEGTIKYDGEPIGVGTITFLPAAQPGITCGGRIENGRYKIEPEFGPMPGQHHVEIRWAKPTGKKYHNEFKEEFDVTREGLPDKYHANSILTATIKPGSNTINFDLEK